MGELENVMAKQSHTVKFKIINAPVTKKLGKMNEFTKAFRSLKPNQHIRMEFPTKADLVRWRNGLGTRATIAGVLLRSSMVAENGHFVLRIELRKSNG